MKICSICGKELPITDYSKKDKKRWRSFCKNCRSIRNEMMKTKKIDIPKLDEEVEIEVRGKLSNGHGYTYFVPYNKAMQMVEEKVAYIVHERLIKKFFDRETFRKLIFQRYGESCFYCGESADTIDHIIPKSKGGLSSFSNCVPACSKCNEVKDNMTLDDFLYYFEPSAIYPGLSKIDSIRFDLMEFTNRVENIKVYLNICLKKMQMMEDALVEPVELEDLEEQVNQINEIIMKFKMEQNHEYLA
ncbi:HNH endonuclease [Heyndrickxia faecalis]|uniref:HNH endonuclease n=1 Tax=Heyndrickxia faecalis TaxID=2824910 RepID=UPI003D1996A5